MCCARKLTRTGHAIPIVYLIDCIRRLLYRYVYICCAMLRIRAEAQPRLNTLTGCATDALWCLNLYCVLQHMLIYIHTARGITYGIGSVGISQ